MHAFKNISRLLILLIVAGLVCSAFSDSVQAWGGSEAAAVSSEVKAETPTDDAEHGATETERRKRVTHDPGILGNLVTLAMLVLLQAVLGFDNLLYISLESKNAPEEKRQSVRAWGIGIAIFLRIGLLFALVSSKEIFEETTVFKYTSEYFSANFNLHSLIVLVGGAFIMYTGVKEIWHMTHLGHDDHDHAEKKTKSVATVIAWIVIMNFVFSIDSILSAIALTDVFWVMTTAIVISGVLMIYLADHVSTFLERNRMYEVLGLFILLIVGIMLVSEGGHLAHLNFFGNDVQAMTKTTFYFVIAVLVLIDIVQGRYQKKLMAAKSKASLAHKNG